ncbi:MAG TPA: DUF4340 domain-containing protein [Burkholderiales bacterium]|nr:DUF4340 domain-containing protein [Burkholderiales bacterium]
MNRKQFLILVVVLLVLGGVGLAMFWENISEYRASQQRIGAKLLSELKVADVAQLELQDAKDKVTLKRQDNGWIVVERGNYPADFKAISDLIIKLIDLKVVQADQVGESLLPRVELVEPGKGEGAGTLVELKDAAGKTLSSVILGKVVLKKDPGNPLPNAVNGVPAGRYVRITANNNVVVVADPLDKAKAQPGVWIDKTFPKVDRIKTLAASGPNAQWKVSREQEWSPWKFAAGGGDLDASAAVSASNALGNLTFSDVSVNGKPEDEGTPTVFTAETFDNLTYTIKVAKRKSGDEYLVNIAVAGEPPAARTPEKDEKPADKEKRDKDFAEQRKRLEFKIAREKVQSQWSYVADAKQVEPLMKSREDLIAKKRAPGEGPAGPPGGMPFGMPPGMAR